MDATVTIADRDLAAYRDLCIENAKSGRWERRVAEEAYRIAGRFQSHLDERRTAAQKLQEGRNYVSKFRTERTESLQRQKTASERERRMKNAQSSWDQYLQTHKAKEERSIERVAQAEEGTKPTAAPKVNLLSSRVFDALRQQTPPPVAARPVIVARPRISISRPRTSVVVRQPEVAAPRGPEITVAKPTGAVVYRKKVIPAKSDEALEKMLQEIKVWTDSQARHLGGELFTKLTAIYQQEGRAVLYAEASTGLARTSANNQRAVGEGLLRIWGVKCQQYGKVWEKSHAHVFIYRGDKTYLASMNDDGSKLAP